MILYDDLLSKGVIKGYGDALFWLGWRKFLQTLEDLVERELSCAKSYYEGVKVLLTILVSWPELRQRVSFSPPRFRHLHGKHLGITVTVGSLYTLWGQIGIFRERFFWLVLGLFFRIRWFMMRLAPVITPLFISSLLGSSCLFCSRTSTDSQDIPFNSEAELDSSHVCSALE